MRADKLAIVNEFKGQLKAVLASKEHVEMLEEKLVEVDSMMAVHSPSLERTHGTPRSHDELLSIWIEKRTRITNELQVLENNRKRVNSILQLIPDEYVEQMINIYKGKYNLEEASHRMGMTRIQLIQRMNRHIYLAVINYEGIEGL